MISRTDPPQTTSNRPAQGSAPVRATRTTAVRVNQPSEGEQNERRRGGQQRRTVQTRPTQQVDCRRQSGRRRCGRRRGRRFVESEAQPRIECLRLGRFAHQGNVLRRSRQGIAVLLVPIDLFHQLPQLHLAGSVFAHQAVVLRIPHRERRPRVTKSAQEQATPETKRYEHTTGGGIGFRAGIVGAGTADPVRADLSVGACGLSIGVIHDDASLHLRAKAPRLLEAAGVLDPCK